MSIMASPPLCRIITNKVKSWNFWHFLLYSRFYFFVCKGYPFICNFFSYDFVRVCVFCAQRENYCKFFFDLKKKIFFSVYRTVMVYSFITMLRAFYICRYLPVEKVGIIYDNKITELEHYTVLKSVEFLGPIFVCKNIM